jgi:hypothetical protein
LSHKLESLQASYPHVGGSALITSFCKAAARACGVRTSWMPIFEVMMARILRGAEGDKSSPSPCHPYREGI